ncbi:MAG: FkbM family methyltransferase [Nitrospirota bacterium]|nr:FkbM family methyltransferase [Nitrospirota bacterium]
MLKRSYMYTKYLIKKVLWKFGFDIQRVKKSGCAELGAPRNSLQGVLGQARRIGFTPGTVVDIGAAFGTFSGECHKVFPDAHYVLVEPIEEYRPVLSKVVRAMPLAINVTAVIAAEDGRTFLNVHHDLVGSSLYREVEEGTDIDGVRREVCAITLDRLVAERNVPPPFLIKIDVQGAELDALAGAQKVLAKTEYVLLEVSLFQFFRQGPVFCDVVAYMKSKGFVPYDIYGLQYRPLDGALSQIDIAFVKEDGEFRKSHHYATPVQRMEQNRELKSYLAGVLPGEPGK